ncbi:Gag-Pol polyprotein [Gossypium australe]|uniref:Gag-Pol polyprotein n=1 Tax=Gossypium australe TaxID=47621 RepID=A0A5B6X6A8_9ROSI|nr:Gag-Pol polyprotein [Gossypium australe]
MTVAEYAREFVRLSKYAQECVSTEATLCKRFEDGLNEDIRLLVGILELKEFVVLVDRACKTEELNKEKRKAMIEARDVRKRPMSKSFQTHSKRSKEMNHRTTVSTGYSHRDRDNTYPGSRVQATSMASVANAKLTNRSVQIVADNILESVGETIELATSVVHPTTSLEIVLRRMKKTENKK